MSCGNLKNEILLSAIKGDIDNDVSKAHSRIKGFFPELTEEHCSDLLGLIVDAMNFSDTDKVSSRDRRPRLPCLCPEQQESS